jgi:class 3 adenylate cyclase
VSVSEWLRSLALAQYTSAFAANAIDWQILPKLSGDDLKEIGVVAVGHRRLLLEAISALPAAESHMPAPTLPAAAERRQLTVMFCDLMGSTALSSRLDPEELSAIIRGYQARVAAIISRFGGFIARYVGDGVVLIYFGWPEAREENAGRAVRAALAVIDTIAQAPLLTEPLQVRIGIHRGLYPLVS